MSEIQYNKTIVMNDTLLLFINGFAGHSSLLDTLMIFIARDLVYIIFAITLACVGVLLYKDERKPVVYFFVTLVVSFLLLQLMSLLNVDHRPFMDHHLTQLVSHAPGKSFPSDHTTVSTAIAVGILFFTRFKKTGALLLLGAMAIGFARIYVGIHYPADILGGLFTGILGGVVVYVAKRIIGMTRKTSVAFSKK
jgi:undecaprenyl-diphosphatase